MVRISKTVHAATMTA